MALRDPGPLRLFTEQDFPVLPETPDFTSPIADALARAGIGRDVIAMHLAGMASVDGLATDGIDGLELGDAAAVHAANATGPDAAIVAVPPAIDALDGQTTGLTNDAASNLAEGLQAPDYVDHTPPGEPGAEQWAAWDTGTIGLFRQLLGRAPTTQEIITARNFSPDFNALTRWVRTLSAAPAPPDEPVTLERTPSGLYPRTAAGVAAFLRDHPERQDEYDRFVDGNPGDELRAPAALDWPRFAG